MFPLSQTAEIDFAKPVPGDTRCYVIRNASGDSYWIPNLEDTVSELESATDDDEAILTFDTETVQSALAVLNPGEEPFRLGRWSVEVQMVDPDWLAQLPEFDGW